MAETRSQGDVHEVDVVICTRNRDASIGSAVRSVLANDHPSFRLTVIDQSTSDATGEVLAPIASADDRLTYVHVDEAGLSRAYNTGIRSTSAEVLAFTDDDCLVPDELDLVDRRCLPSRTRRRSSLWSSRTSRRR